MFNLFKTKTTASVLSKFHDIVRELDEVNANFIAKGDEKVTEAKALWERACLCQDKSNEFYKEAEEARVMAEKFQTLLTPNVL